MESGNITELADPELKGKFDSEQVHRVVLTASYCVRESSTWRPSMSEVRVTLLCARLNIYIQVHSPFENGKQLTWLSPFLVFFAFWVGVRASNQWAWLWSCKKLEDAKVYIWWVRWLLHDFWVWGSSRYCIGGLFVSRHSFYFLFFFFTVLGFFFLWQERNKYSLIYNRKEEGFSSSSM